MKRLAHTPRSALWTLLGLAALVTASGLSAQSASPSALLDALSITIQNDTTAVARGSMRFRQVRTATDVELIASGIVVRRGLRVSGELRTDSTYALRKYVAESRDSTGRLIDRVQVTSAGGRVTLERVTPTRRTVREYVAQRDIMILDSTAVVPFLVLAGLALKPTSLAFLDVRRGTLTTAQAVPGTLVELSMAEATVGGTPVAVTGLAQPLSWWRDARGRLLRVSWGARSRVMRDDPPT